MNYNGKPVPAVVIKRLPRYYRYLGELLKQDITRISSNSLSKKMSVTASQIRQDFNYFGGFGQQGYGYNVQYLYDEIGNILGLHDGYHTIIVGAGNLGRALANHNTFKKRGFTLVGIFDNDPSVIGRVVNGVTVFDVAQLGEFISNNKVDIGIITVPKAAVQSVADSLIEYGIKGILNFSYDEINTKNRPVAVENVHLSDSLMTLSYEIKRMESENK